MGKGGEAGECEAGVTVVLPGKKFSRKRAERQSKLIRALAHEEHPAGVPVFGPSPVKRSRNKVPPSKR